MCFGRVSLLFLSFSRADLDFILILGLALARAFDMKVQLFLFLCSVLLITTLSAQPQNLVPNSSFEQVMKLPCKFANSTDKLSTFFFGWINPTGGTTDAWFNSSVIDTCILNTAIYNIKPRTGSFCAGILAATSLPENLTRVSTGEYREYAQAKLNKPLVVGRTYYAEMYVLPLNVSEVFNNNLGIHFTVDALQQYVRSDKNSFVSKLPGSPIINEKKVLNVPNKWVKVSGCFKAKEAFSYITIGNFFSDQNTLFTVNPNFTKLPVLSRIACYYLIDDVLVRESTETEIARAFGQNIDTTLCQQATWTVNPQLPAGVTVSWENGSNVPIRTITQPGRYFITTSRGECASTDTLRVKREVNPILPPDTVLCRGETLQLSANHPLKKYLWSNGSTDSSISITETGTYQLRIPSPYCRLSDEINVHFLDCPGLIPNVITPNGDGKNDMFRLDNIDLTDWKFEVYNRWGKRVHTSFPYRNEWDGGNLPSGVYYYSLQSAALKRELKGWIQLVR